MTRPDSPLTVAFVLVSYRHDEPAGMERATAATAAGLRALGHTAYIISAAPAPPTDTDIVALTSLPVGFPCDDDTLRATVLTHHTAVTAQLAAILTARATDIVVYVDCLWGLGRLAAEVEHSAHRVLAVHVLGHARDLAPALAAADQVFAPSSTVVDEAAANGYRSRAWQVIANPLLIDPDQIARPDTEARDRLRRTGPVRLVTRLGSEKGVGQFLAAPNPTARPVQVVAAAAGFETAPGSQQQLGAHLRRLARDTGVTLLSPLPWAAVPDYLAGAAVTVVPSLRESFGNLAAESLSAATPVVAYRVGNLPQLIGPDAGICVDPAEGPAGLWRAVEELTADPLRYGATCGAAYCRSRNYRPTLVAETFVKGCGR
ncbi:glycosyltransferase family 4 protein [Nocardia takedensis]|uniref:glycosyltransferase family 4 protein n=1 Tax=Nocardia takedensis TaxID=259390 RepID=UPI003F76063B